MLNEKFGISAGLVWNLLSEKGPMNVKDVKKGTKLTEKDMYAAFGWLTREDKIRFEEKDKELFVSLV
ncbi:MAG: winged helix-turn-helix domain-containing protein [Candidatus Azobacteroides sp.]|nr:winged helix-turn-helix domain-containing protein [Candidatus Azobacteroides sp.]